MICLAWRSDLICQSGHVSFGCSFGRVKSRAIHRCSESNSSRCCFVVVHDSAPHVREVVMIASKSLTRRFNVACLSCGVCFCPQ